MKPIGQPKSGASLIQQSSQVKQNSTKEHH
nr:MAG TPA: hypothetical protein [Caudoviricetes sp.]